MTPTAVYVLCYPVLCCRGRYYFHDRRNFHTGESLVSVFQSITIISRVRYVTEVPRSAVEAPVTWMEKAIFLPDFGRKPWTLPYLLLGIPLLRKIKSALSACSVIYSEVPSLEAWYIANFLRSFGGSLIIELNTECTLEFRYMRQRFGRMGIVMARMLRRMFAAIRRRANGGLFLNKALMEKYPIEGSRVIQLCDPTLGAEWFSCPSRVYKDYAKEFLFIGNLEPVKHPQLLIRALAQVSSQLPGDWVLRVVGDGPLSAELSSLVQQLGLQQRVRFLGYLPRDKNLIALFLRSDLLLISSLSETGPRVMLEAMACGLPVLSTQVGLANELLPSDCLVPIDDLEAYSAALLQLASSPTRLCEISVKGCSGAREFAFEQVSARRKNFLRQFLPVVD